MESPLRKYADPYHPHGLYGFDVVEDAIESRGYERSFDFTLSTEARLHANVKLQGAMVRCGLRSSQPLLALRCIAGLIAEGDFGRRDN
jgi:hypothetical protein